MLNKSFKGNNSMELNSCYYFQQLLSSRKPGLHKNIYLADY